MVRFCLSFTTYLSRKIPYEKYLETGNMVPLQGGVTQNPGIVLEKK
jgi:hypothetical protein